MGGRRSSSKRVSPRMRVDPEFADLVEDIRKRLGLQHGTDVTKIMADEINNKERGKKRGFKIF